ncbi:VirB4 family type IV secretion system protein [Chondrinema litorale]|uniref:VirB4 family type IV secretion system protein n=1 Tax=Chondrinema litorale TaxID=2994555 RepID=UPI0025437A58|nr:DUF87 domain-containing protein [Chondrinema litorale]UZS00061.1 DUF87 domain-containing protein [Chondrinema litorale]
MILARPKKKKRYSKPYLERQPIFGIEDNKVYLNNGRVAIGFKVNAVEMESLNADEYAVINEALSRGLSKFPVGTVIQKTDIYYDDRYDSDQENDNTYFVSRMDAYYFERLQQIQKDYFFISFPIDSQYKANAFNSIFALGLSVVKNPFSNIEERASIAEKYAKDFISGLEGIGGLSFSRLSTKELEVLYYQYSNLDFKNETKSFEKEFSNQLGNCQIGEKKINVVSLKGQGFEIFDSVPNEFGIDAPFIWPLTYHLDFPHILTQTLIVEDDSALNLLDFEKKVNSGLSWMSTQDNDLKAETISNFTNHIRAGNNRVCGLGINVICFSADDYEREDNVQNTLNAFSLMGCEAFVETYDTATMFFASFPANGFSNYHILQTSSDIGSKYFHFTKSYTSAHKGEIYLNDRFRKRLRVNLFNTHLNNQNAIVIGPTGSGKSFTVGYFICQRHEKKSRQIIIDNGGSYKNLMKMLKEDQYHDAYFEYDFESPFSLNPFLVPKSEHGNWLLSDHKELFIVACLRLMYKGPGGYFEQVEIVILHELVTNYYRYLNQNKEAFPTLSGFYNWARENDAQKRLEDDEDYIDQMECFKLKQFLLTIKPFSTGRYSKGFNSKNKLDISDQEIICFDMRKIKEDPLLAPVVGLMITELAMDQIRKFPNEIKYIYMDEAWSMLNSLGDFVESMFRTIRKENGSMWIITQTIHEIANSNISKAIIINADTKVILNHQSQQAEVSELSSHLAFTDIDISKINSLRKESNSYREIFIKQGNYSRVYCLEAPPHIGAAITSKPSERNAINVLVEKNGNIKAAIDEYVEKQFLTNDNKVSNDTYEEETSPLAVKKSMSAK